jgi:uncharacterized protein (DUF697 family)/tellurite resistance protein
MPITQEEAVAGLHILVAVAQADGKLHDEEKKALESAISEVGLTDVVGAGDLFDDAFDLDEQIALLRSPDARDATFRSAYSLAYADGECSHEERELLDKLKGKLGIPTQREEELRKLFSDLVESNDGKKSFFVKIDDPAERTKAVRSETLKCSVVSAVLGAFPFPGLAILTDLAVLYLQISLVRDIGAMHGQAVDKTRARGLLAGVGVGTTARLAVSNLAKLLPGWGSVVGATTSFASTYGVGLAFDKHFAAGLDEAALAEEFKKAKDEGKKEYEAQKATIEEKGKAKKDELAELAEQRKSGILSDEDFQERVSRI